MVTVPALDRLTRADTTNVRLAGTWQKMCEKIEEAFAEIIASQATIAAVQAALATKAEIYRQNDAPVGATEPALWLDENDGDKAYWLISGVWTAAQDIGAAYARLGVNSDGTIKADKVVTGSIVAGVVLSTPGTAASSSTTITSGGYTWTDCDDVTFTASGADVTVRCDFNVEVVDNCKYMYRLRVSGSTLGREVGPITVSTGDQPGASLARRFTPSAGSVTVTLQAACNDANDIIVHDPVFDITENNNL